MIIYILFILFENNLLKILNLIRTILYILLKHYSAQFIVFNKERKLSHSLNYLFILKMYPKLMLVHIIILYLL